MIYRVLLIWRSGRAGWTEEYYRDSSSARAATDLGGPGGLVHALALRSPPAELQAVRAEEVGGIGRIHVRELHHRVATRGVTPEPAPVTARVWWPWPGGNGGRRSQLRGLPDEWVRRDARTGDDRPHPELLRRLDRWGDTVRRLGLRGRLWAHQEVPVGLHSAGRHPTRPAEWTQVFMDAPPALPIGSRVNFLGLSAGAYPLQRAADYVVTEVTDSWLSLLHTWPDGWEAQRLIGIGLRVADYTYPLLGAPELVALATRDTGRAYLPASWTWTGPRAPLDPCGRVVDYLRFCYGCRMAPYVDDSGLSLPAAWYWAREGAPAVPYEHPFGSRAWGNEGVREAVLGERGPRLVTRGLDRTGLRGVGVCGTADQWYAGCTTGDGMAPENVTTGQPCCCGPGARVWAGGSAGGGAAEVLALAAGGSAGGGDFPLLAAGGSAGGGAAEVLALAAGGSAGGGELAEGPGTVETVLCTRPVSRLLRLDRTAFTGDCDCWPSPLYLAWDDGAGLWRATRAGNICGSAFPYSGWTVTPTASGLYSMNTGLRLLVDQPYDCEAASGSIGPVSGTGYCTGSWSGVLSEV